MCPEASTIDRVYPGSHKSSAKKSRSKRGTNLGASSNGKTAASKTANDGSIPSAPANMVNFILGIFAGFWIAWGSMYLLSWMFSGHFYDDLKAWKKKIF